MVATALKGKVIWVEKAFFGLAFYLSFPLVTEVAVKAAAAFRKYKKKAHLKKKILKIRILQSLIMTTAKENISSEKVKLCCP